MRPQINLAPELATLIIPQNTIFHVNSHMVPLQISFISLGTRVQITLIVFFLFLKDECCLWLHLDHFV